jgi:prevent-host-death family protein
MDPVNIRYARQHFRELIDEVADGGQVMLVRRGEPVARLVGVEVQPPTLPSLKKFRQQLGYAGRPLSEEVVHARQDERY